MKTPTLDTCIERTLVCLALAGRSEIPVPFSEFCAALGKPSNNAVSRLLNSLVANGLLRRVDHPRGYLPTEKLHDQAWAMLGDLPLHARMRNLVNEVAGRVHESVAVFEGVRGAIKIVVKREFPNSHAYLQEGEIRQVLGGHGSAVALCAFNPHYKIHAAKRLRGDLDLTRKEFEARLAKARRLGYDYAYGEEFWEHRANRSETVARLSIPILQSDDAAPNYCLAISWHARSKDDCPSDATIQEVLQIVQAFSLQT